MIEENGTQLSENVCDKTGFQKLKTPEMILSSCIVAVVPSSVWLCYYKKCEKYKVLLSGKISKINKDFLNNV